MREEVYADYIRKMRKFKEARESLNASEFSPTKLGQTGLSITVKNYNV